MQTPTDKHWVELGNPEDKGQGRIVGARKVDDIGRTEPMESTK